MTTKAEVLMDARDLVSDPTHWVRGEIATNDRGHVKSPHDTYATKFCAQGAVRRCVKKVNFMSSVMLLNILDQAAMLQGTGNHVLINDDFGHDAVIQMFDDAIRIAKEQDL